MPGGSTLIVIARTGGGDVGSVTFDGERAQPAAITMDERAKDKRTKGITELCVSPTRLVAILRLGQTNNRIRRATISGACFGPVPTIASP